MNDDELRQLNLTDWPAPAGYLVELGRVSLVWNLLEWLLATCLGKLAGFNDADDPRAFILTTHMSVRQKLDVLGALCEQLAPVNPSLRDYRAVVKQLEAAQAARNKFVHAAMAMDPETGSVTMSIGSARGSLKAKIEEVDIADLRRALVEIHLASLALYKLVLRREIKPIWEQRGAG